MAFFRIFYKQVSATPHGAVEGDLKCVDVQDYKIEDGFVLIWYDTMDRVNLPDLVINTDRVQEIDLLWKGEKSDEQ